MRILELLGLSSSAERAAEIEGLGAIERQLDALDPDRARFVARFAYLLARVARADHEVSAEEAAVMERLVAEHAGLAPSEASIAVRIATAHGLREGGTDDFLVSREFAALATPEEKRRVLDCLFAVSAADESIRTVEDNEIRRIAAELRIDHPTFIEARAAHVRHLEVLRRPARGPSQDRSNDSF